MAKYEIRVDVTPTIFGLTIDELHEAVQHYRGCTNYPPRVFVPPNVAINHVEFLDGIDGWRSDKLYRYVDLLETFQIGDIVQIETPLDPTARAIIRDITWGPQGSILQKRFKLLSRAAK